MSKIKDSIMDFDDSGYKQSYRDFITSGVKQNVSKAWQIIKESSRPSFMQPEGNWYNER